jgi:hypothetical protein
MSALRLTVKLILRWADAHRERTGTWPHARSGPVAGADLGAANRALYAGNRCPPGGDTLPRLLRRNGRPRSGAPAGEE